MTPVERLQQLAGAPQTAGGWPQDICPVSEIPCTGCSLPVSIPDPPFTDPGY